MVNLTFAWLLVAVLAVWRVTHLFWGEDGPFDAFVRFRHLAGQGFLGRLLDCFYCMSLWIAVPFAWLLAVGWQERGMLWLGLSGGAILLERATAAKSLSPPPAVWQERPLETEKKESKNDVMLR